VDECKPLVSGVGGVGGGMDAAVSDGGGRDAGVSDRPDALGDGAGVVFFDLCSGKVGRGGCCLPRHPTQFHPSSLVLNGTL